jgi:hypothetical protein
MKYPVPRSDISATIDDDGHRVVNGRSIAPPPAVNTSLDGKHSGSYSPVQIVYSPEKQVRSNPAAIEYGVGPGDNSLPASQACPASQSFTANQSQPSGTQTVVGDSTLPVDQQQPAVRDDHQQYIDWQKEQRVRESRELAQHRTQVRLKAVKVQQRREFKTGNMSPLNMTKRTKSANHIVEKQRILPSVMSVGNLGNMRVNQRNIAASPSPEHDKMHDVEVISVSRPRPINQVVRVNQQSLVAPKPTLSTRPTSPKPMIAKPVIKKSRSQTSKGMRRVRSEYPSTSKQPESIPPDVDEGDRRFHRENVPTSPASVGSPSKRHRRRPKTGDGHRERRSKSPKKKNKKHSPRMERPHTSPVVSSLSEGTSTLDNLELLSKDKLGGSATMSWQFTTVPGTDETSKPRTVVTWDIHGATPLPPDVLHLATSATAAVTAAATASANGSLNASANANSNANAHAVSVTGTTTTAEGVPVFAAKQSFTRARQSTPPSPDSSNVADKQSKLGIEDQRNPVPMVVPPSLEPETKSPVQRSPLDPPRDKPNETPKRPSDNPHKRRNSTSSVTRPLPKDPPPTAVSFDKPYKPNKASKRSPKSRRPTGYPNKPRPSSARVRSKMPLDMPEPTLEGGGDVLGAMNGSVADLTPTPQRRSLSKAASESQMIRPTREDEDKGSTRQKSKSRERKQESFKSSKVSSFCDLGLIVKFSN